MATTNKGLDQPALNATNWNVPLNANFGIIDDALGGVTSINVTGAGTGPTALTQAQYQKLALSFSGTLSNNVDYSIPSGVGGQWQVSNATTGSFTLTISSGGGGASAVIPQGARRIVFSDGSNIYLSDNSLSNISSTQIAYGSGASITGSANLTYDGTKVSVRAVTATTNAATEVLRLDSQSSGTPAVGIGALVTFASENSAGTSKDGMQLSMVATDVTPSSEDFDFSVRLMDDGTLGERFRVSSDGQARVASVVDLAGGNTVTVNGVTPALASQAEAEAGTDNTKQVTPLRIRNALNATGSAPIYACRAWVNFDGTTASPTIRASGNVSSITDVGAGQYGINFTTALPDANYSVVAGVGPGYTADARVSPYIASVPTTSSVQMNFIHANTYYYDWAYITVAVFR